MIANPFVQIEVALEIFLKMSFGRFQVHQMCLREIKILQEIFQVLMLKAVVIVEIKKV